MPWNVGRIADLPLHVNSQARIRRCNARSSHDHKVVTMTGGILAGLAAGICATMFLMILSMSVLSTFTHSATEKTYLPMLIALMLLGLIFLLLATVGSTLLTAPGVTPAFIGGSLAAFAVVLTRRLRNR